MQCSLLLVPGNDPSLKIALQETLPSKNFKITMASSKEEALRLISISSYTVVIWEMENSSSDQIQFLRELKLLDSSIPAIVFSKNNDENYILQLFSLGAFASLQNFVNITELMELIKSAAETHKEGDELQIISAKPHWIEVILPPRTNYIPRLSNLLARLVRNLEERECQRLLYAFRELLQNAIEHGSRFSATQKILIRYMRSQHFLLFYIEDEGTGFDFSCIPHAAIGGKKNAAMEVMQYRKQIGMRPGGLGIASVISIADELYYSQRGNAVVMIKYYNSELSES